MSCASQRLSAVPYFLSFHRALEELDISDNVLVAILPNSFHGVQVHRISLNNNLISDLTKNSFSGLKLVRSINLCHNQLHTITEDVFVPLAEFLTELKLCYNRLNVLKSRVFLTLTLVTHLDLSGNELVSVPTHALKPMMSLSALNLRNNRLKKLLPYAFSHIPLMFIDLGDNASPLHLDQQAFCGLEPKSFDNDQQTHSSKMDIPGLRELILDHNGLGSMEPCLAKLLWTLKSIDLTGNPIRCDCRLFLYKEWGAPTQFPGAQCAVPWLYEGEMLDNLLSVNYSCADENADQLYQDCSSLCPEIIEVKTELDYSRGSILQQHLNGILFVTCVTSLYL